MKSKILVCIILAILFWMIRLPAFQLGWDSTDSNGHDVDIFVNQPPAPNYLLLSRMNGQASYQPPTGHPGTIYALFALNGQVVESIVPIDSMGDQQIVVFLKVLVTLIHFLIYSGITLYILRYIKSPQKKFWSILALTFLANAPIALYSSNEFQIDSYLGFLMLGLLCFTLLPFMSNQKVNKPIHYVLLTLAAAFLGLGKNEWSLMLLLAIFTIGFINFFIIKFITKQPLDSRFYKMLFFLIVGSLLGNFINYMFDKYLYLSGIALLTQMTKTASIAGSGGASNWYNVMLSRLPFISTIIILIIVILTIQLKNIKRINYYHLFIFLLGFLLFFSFFLSSWGDYSRYFAPGLLVLTFTLFIYIRHNQLGRFLKIELMIMFLIIGIQTFNLLGQFHLQSKTNNYFDLSAYASDNCVSLIDVGRVYRNPQIDFVHIGMGFELAKQIASDSGKFSCSR